VRRPVLALLGNVDFVDAVLQEVREPALKELQRINRRFDRSLPAVPLGNLEGLVLRRRRLLVQDPRNGLRLEIQQLRHVAQRLRCLERGKSGHASRVRVTHRHSYAIVTAPWAYA